MEIAPAGALSNGGGEGGSVAAVPLMVESSTTESSSSFLFSPDEKVISNGRTLNRFDDDEDVCGICRNPGEVGNSLRYPCACSGSIKFVHEQYLCQWLLQNAFGYDLLFFIFYSTQLFRRSDFRLLSDLGQSQWPDKCHREKHFFRILPLL